MENHRFLIGRYIFEWLFFFQPVMLVFRGCIYTIRISPQQNLNKKRLLKTWFTSMWWPFDVFFFESFFFHGSLDYEQFLVGIPGGQLDPINMIQRWLRLLKSTRFFYCFILNCCTLPETNSKFTPEKQRLEDEISFWGPVYFSGAKG